MDIVWVPQEDSYWEQPHPEAAARTDYVVLPYQGDANSPECAYCHQSLTWDSSVPDLSYEPPAPGYWRGPDRDAACPSSNQTGDTHVPVSNL